VTIKRALVFLQNLYMMAITWDKATENTVKKVRFTRENNGRMHILTPEEETRLLVHCGPQLRPLVITASHTRFRASELLSLTWEDVNFHRRVFTVRAAYVKNGESRSVPMNEVLTAALQAVRMSVSVAGPVFRARTGEPYRSFRTAFTHAVRQAGMIDFTFYDLRHIFASRLVMSGVDLPTG
jgi:integrase